MKPWDLRVENLSNPIALPTPSPRFSWKLPREARGQTAYQIVVTSRADQPGAHPTARWDSGQVSSDRTWLVPYGGPALVSGQMLLWRVRVWFAPDHASDWSEAAAFGIGLLGEDAWQARWISLTGDAGTPAGRHFHVPAMAADELTAWHQIPELRRASVCLRGAFEISTPVVDARVHICGLGHYLLWCNGRRASDDELQPAWSDYDRRCYANTYDVTALLRPGRNVLAVLLGNGFFNVAGGAGRYAKLHVSFGAPKLRLEARLRSADGTERRIITDQSWRGAPSAITFNCIYGGEDFDARRHEMGWTEPDYDDSAWSGVIQAAPPPGRIVPQRSAPLRGARRREASLLGQIKPGVFVYDLLQNHAGIPDLVARGPAGAGVRLIPGEALTRDGLVDQGSAGGPGSRGRTCFNYTLRGHGSDEAWSPSFSYYGYRYLQAELSPATGSSALPVIGALGSRELQSSLSTVGTWSCSHPLLNRIHELTLAAARSNLQHVLTDCPHREKLGWLEVSYLMGPSLAFNYDLHGFLHKVLDDMADAQQPDGLIPNHAPEYSIFDDGAPGYSDQGFRDSPEWGSAIFHLSELACRWYGDDEPARRHYGTMTRYTAYLLARRRDGILEHGLSDWMDASPPDGSLPGTCQLTGRGLTATATMVRNLRTLARLAPLAGRPADVPRWQELAGQTIAAFNRCFFDPHTGLYDTGSQTALAMPLALDLVDPTKVATVVGHLVARIERDGFQVRTGDIGHVYLIEALARHGCNELLWKLVTRPTPPSYGGMIATGATTLTEDWNADPRLSLNHLMLGHIEQWFYQHLAGLQPEQSSPAWRDLRIQPWFAPGLTHVSASHDSPHGRFAIEWRRQPSGQVGITLDLPPNTTARLVPPAGFQFANARLTADATSSQGHRLASGHHSLLLSAVPS